MVLCVLTLGLYGCTSFPAYRIKAVEPFDKTKYLGMWYEIARMDFRFERNLSHVTATYSENPDGTIRVVNKGYNTKKGKWQQAIGKARFKGAPTTGSLEVSFFGPFYADYHVLAVDPDYQTALVGGKNTGYIWILSRTKTISESLKERYLQQALSLGFETDKLVWTEQ